MLAVVLACGPGDSNGPTLVPNLNGSWLVTADLSVSLDGQWMCTIDQTIFDLVQTSDTFTGTAQGGGANCVSTSADSSSESLDGGRIFNGVIDPVGNLEFNFRTIDNLHQGVISADRESITGMLSWTFVLPPSIAVFFIGTWSAQRI